MQFFQKVNRCFRFVRCPPPEGWWVGKAEKWRSLFLGVELAVRCERNEHGKSQLSIKCLCSILVTFFNSHQLSIYLCVYRNSLSFFASKMRRRCPTLAVYVPAAWRSWGSTAHNSDNHRRLKDALKLGLSLKPQFRLTACCMQFFLPCYSSFSSS